MVHMLQWPYTHVARVCFKCFRCFRGMLQVFHMHVAKVDQDVAHVAMVVNICCKRLFQMFHLFFSDICCKCAYLDIAYVSHICLQVLLSGCCICFAMALKCF